MVEFVVITDIIWDMDVKCGWYVINETHSRLESASDT